MRAENSPRRKLWLATLLLLVVLVNFTSKAIKHPKYITFELPAVNSVCTAADDPTTARTASSLRLLVSYVFFETGGMKACEVSNKRINLATFLISAVSSSTSDVHYVFTFPARKPRPSDILDSAGISPESDPGKVIADALTSSGMQNIELLDASVKHPAADLCHHHAVILEKKRKGQTFDYVLVLNDGVRGPFFDPRKMAEMV